VNGRGQAVGESGVARFGVVVAVDDTVDPVVGVVPVLGGAALAGEAGDVGRLEAAA